MLKIAYFLQHMKLNLTRYTLQYFDVVVQCIMLLYF